VAPDRRPLDPVRPVGADVSLAGPTGTRAPRASTPVPARRATETNGGER
jgi:hypothetical protein